MNGFLEHKSVKQIPISKTEENKRLSKLKKIIKTNNTSINYIDQVKEIKSKLNFSKPETESEKNIKNIQLANEFMSVRAGKIKKPKQKSKATHKKGNKSMNLQNQTTGNQLYGMNAFPDFDLQTLDLGESDVKT